MAESEEELKSLLIRVKEESDKAGLKLNILKTKIVASSPTTSWQIEKGEGVIDFLSLDSRITADSDCSHEIKRCLFLGRKARTNLDQIRSVAQLCPTLCNPMNHSMSGLPVLYQLPEVIQTHVL